MKIAFVTQNYLPFIGGIETHVGQVAQALSDRHQVAVAAVCFERTSVPRRLAVLAPNLLVPWNKGGRMDGAVQVYSLSPGLGQRMQMLPIVLRALPRIQRWFYHFVNRITYPYYYRAMVPQLTRVIRSADVVHSMGASDLGWGAEAVARRYGIPVVCTPFVHPHQWGDGPDDLAFYHRCTAIVGLLPSDCAYLAKIGVPEAKLREIGVSPSLPPSIDSAAFRRRARLSDEPVILFVGRMVATKGAKAVLQAAPLVWKQLPKAQFVFIGPGNSEDTAIFDNFDARVRYLGRATDQEKAEALAACDVFCMPSVSEILPTVYLEAWSLGKPVIGGMAQGLQELVEGNNAGIAVTQTAEAVSEAILRVLGNLDLSRKFGENGRQLVCDNYSVSAVSKRLEELYNQVVQDSPARK